MAPMYLGFLGMIPDGPAAAPFILPWIMLVSAGVISQMPTYSGKSGGGSRVRRDMALPVVAATVFGAVLLITYPWEVMTALACVYVALMPFGVRSYRRRTAAWEAANLTAGSHKDA